MRYYHLIIFFFFSISISFGQEITQTLKGKIIDQQSKFPLPGVTVIILNTNPLLGAVTNEDGDFKITNVPLGRQTVKVNYLGYNELVIPNVLITSGKEVVLNLEMEEMIAAEQEIELIATKDKTQPENEMAVISARSFSIEETNRYAGSRNDPARMAMNFAGVSGTSDARNDIIIRGNSPLGLLWRMEGIDIPSPNHFGSFGTTGGPVSILNNNVLSNSDFYTGAFPAQYGNALSGIFDLRMRKGNSDKREYMGQIGFNGLEGGIEGPFKKNSRSSYLFNYRYSTLGVFKALGISFGTSALPEYQDFSYKVFIPTGKNSVLTLFGLGGYSHVYVNGHETDTTDLFSDPGMNTYFKSLMGVAGASYMVFHNDNTYSKVTGAVSGTTMQVINDSIPRVNGSYLNYTVPTYRSNFGMMKVSLNYSINKKFSARNTVTAGATADQYLVNMRDSLYYKQFNKFYTLRNTKDQSLLLQSYFQWQHRFTESFSVIPGLHYQLFTFNGSSAVEPRIGARYQLNKRRSINFGYGLHSQLQPFQAYFREDTLENGDYIKTNKNLKFTRSHQVILGYDQSFGNNVRIKVETYYQYLFDAGVENKPSSFSLLNSGADFVIVTADSLVNKGLGRNYGLEITFERFFSRSYYYLVTASIYDSKYKGSDNVWRNTAFNGNYVFNTLFGKEFKVKKKNTFAIDIRNTMAGGRRYTPVNEQLSKLYGHEVRNTNEAYSKQLRNYWRLDVKLSFRLNGKKVLQEWAFDVQNVFNRKNAFIQKYNVSLQRTVIVPQLGLFPVLQYRVRF